MIRTQVYFTKDDYLLIQMLAHKKGQKKAEIIRTALKAGLATIRETSKKGSPVEGFKKMAQMGLKGPKDLSEKLDEYLYGAKSEYDKRLRKNSR